MSEIQCPNCSAMITDTSSIDGSVSCECGHTVYIDMTEPLQPTEFAEFPPIQPSEESDEPSNKPNKVVLGGIAGGVVVLVALVVYLVVGGSGDQQPGQDQTSVADQDTDPNPVVEQSDPEEFDLSTLTTLDTTEPAPSNPVAQTPAPRRGPSRWYGDLATVSADPGVVLRVDGVEQVELASLSLGQLELPVPDGVHVVSHPGQATSKTHRSGGFRDYYADRRRRFQNAAGLDFKKLASAAVASGRIHNDPILTHLLGDYYWSQDQREAAVRFWNLTVLMAPPFAPAHLNLAFAYQQSGDQKAAARELAFATQLNVQDTFGINGHIAELSRTISSRGAGQKYSPEDYQSGAALAGTTRQVVHVMLAMHDLTTTDKDRASCLNNIGVYLTQQAGHPDVAVGYLLQALRQLESEKESSIRRVILDNLVKASDKAGFAEADLFRMIASAK